MRIIRVQYEGHVFFAGLGDGEVYCLNQQLGLSEPIALAKITLMPLISPSKIICVTNNYLGQGHSFSGKEPRFASFFFKPPSALSGNGQTVRIPSHEASLSCSASLGLIVGQNCRNIRPDEAPRHIFGYTCAMDFCAGQPDPSDPLVTAKKAYDGFCPIGPWLETEEPDKEGTSIRLVVNGEQVGENSTHELLLSAHSLISVLSQTMSLNPGDLILTGAAVSYGPLQAGDIALMEIPGIGVLFNSIEAEHAPALSPVQ